MKKLLAIVGPTGTGKTDLALALAKKFGGELISADSRQIYIGMDIGTGKIYEKEGKKIEKNVGYWVVDRIPIYLYDLITPDQTFSLADFQRLAYQKINDIHQKNKLPILVGGTGFYISSVIEGLKLPKVPPDKSLRNHLASKPLEELLKELQAIDPETYKKIDKSNSRRIIRAIEVYYQTGRPLSSFRAESRPIYDTLQIVLNTERKFLYQKLDQQVENWFAEGFLREVKKLLDQGYSLSLPAMSSLGYRQAAMYLQGKLSLEEAKQRVKWERHSYVRRQLTWFKKRSKILWFDISDKDFAKKVFNTVSQWLS